MTNPAAVAVSNVSVSDTFPGTLSGCAWTCAASSGGACQSASGSSNISTTANSIAGGNGTLTFGATCTLSASATGSLADTATVSYANDTNAANNNATDTDTITPLADLSLTNSDGVSSVNAGANVSYTITATNPSSNAVSGVSIADTFPATLSACTWSCATSSGGACQSASGSGNIATTTNSIAASGGTLTYSATCTLSASATGSLVNIAALAYAGDGNSTNNSAMDTDTIVPRADLALANSDGLTNINAGANTTYTITVTNPASVAVSGVGVSDTFPATLSACTWSCAASSGGACQSANGSGNIATTTNTIAATSGTLTFNATCTLAASAAGSLANTAALSYANDNNAANNSVTDTDTILPQADLSMANTDGVAAINAGAAASYTITVTNPTANVISNVTVTDAFPATLSSCSWGCTAIGGSCGGAASGTGNISRVVTIAASGNVKFTPSCTLAASATGTLDNTATLSYPNDTNNANDSATDSDDVVARTDLSITNSDGLSTINAGANTTYTIIASNPAAVAIDNALIIDTFPAALTGCTWTCTASSGGVCANPSGSGNVNQTETIGATGTVTISATCTVDPATTSSITNTSTLTYGNDPSTANNTASDTDTVVPLTDLSITNSDGVTSLNAGSNTTYSIVVTNPATFAVSSVGVSDPFPASLTGCSWTCTASSGGSCQSASGSGNIATTTNSIAANSGTLNFSATCTVDPTTTSSVTNTATLSYANDSNAANNSVGDTDAIVPQADLSIANSDGVGNLNAGSNTTYAIVVTNPATVAVSNVSVSDTFPGTLSGCAWTCAASSGGSCQSATGIGNITTTTNSIAGTNGTLSFSATCTLSPSATGTLANSASVAYANDPASGNNSKTDTDTIGVQANLAVTLTDNRNFVQLGDVLDYIIEVTNPSGPSTAVASVSDTLPAQLSGGSWICTETGSAVCNNGSGNALSDTATIPVGGKAAYTYSATVQSAGVADQLLNTASASLTLGSDPVSGNNSASDTDIVVIFRDGFEGAQTLQASVNSAGAEFVTAKLGVDAGLLSHLSSVPVTVASGHSVDGKRLFSLDLARFGGDIALRTVTTDVHGRNEISPWRTVDLKQHLLEFAWQSASEHRNDGYLTAGGSGGTRALIDGSGVPDRLSHLLIRVENSVPWLIVIER